MFNKLPKESRLYIYSFLSNRDLANTLLTSKASHADLTSDDWSSYRFWRDKCVCEFGCDIPNEYRAKAKEFYGSIKAELELAISCAQSPNKIHHQKGWTCMPHYEIISQQKKLFTLFNMPEYSDFLHAYNEKYKYYHVYFQCPDADYISIYKSLIANSRFVNKDTLHDLSIYSYFQWENKIKESKVSENDFNKIRQSFLNIFIEPAKRVDLNKLNNSQRESQIRSECETVKKCFRLLAFLSIQKTNHLFYNLINLQPSWSSACFVFQHTIYFMSLLNFACIHGNVSSAKLLLEKGASADFFKTFKTSNEEAIELSNFGLYTPLSATLRILKKLLKFKENRALNYAHIVDLLLDHGANPSWREEFLNKPPKTPAEIALNILNKYQTVDDSIRQILKRVINFDNQNQSVNYLRKRT